MDKARNGPFIALIFGTVIVLVLSVMPTMYAEAKNGSFGGGDGTPANPYVIEDVWDLQNMTSDLNAHYVLGNDIDASDTVGWNEGAGFAPVGTSSNKFTGSLDGSNHTIRGLFIYRPSTIGVGLFGFVGKGGSVTNVGLVNDNITGSVYVGGAVGYADQGTVSNSYAIGDVNGHSWVGGLVGNNLNGTIRDSHATGNVTGAGRLIGGLVGVSRGEVSDSYAVGNVSGCNYTGGLVGGLASAYLSDSYFIGDVAGREWVGGLVGAVEYGALIDSYFTGDVTGEKHVGGLVGSIPTGTLTNSYYNIDEVMLNGGHHVTVGGIFGSQYRDWFSNGLSLDIEDYRTSLVPWGDSYNFSTVQGIRDLLGFTQVGGPKFRLSADIDLSTAPGLYIPYLVGELDGAGHSISNLSIHLTFADFVGMVGLQYSGMVKNLVLTDTEVVGCSYVGGLIGMDRQGAVANSWVAGNVSGEEYVGGLLGLLYYGELDRSHSGGKVIGTLDEIGGLVGRNEQGSIINSSASGDVTGGPLSVGGLVGYNWGTVISSHAIGNVTGDGSHVGGLLGFNSDAVSGSYATGTVNGNWNVGGLVGYNTGAISTSYAGGNVVGMHNVGGLLGYNGGGTVFDSYAVGRVTGGETAGGLIGYQASGDVKFCYASVNVTGDTEIGGLLGNSHGDDLYGCFWDKETSGFDSGYGGQGKTTNEMKTRSTFTDAGWDFTTLWCMAENVTYPLLRWQDTEPPVAEAGNDRHIEAGEVIFLNGSGSTDDLGIADFVWTFVDGLERSLHGCEVAYRFGLGNHSVTLTVIDAVGNQDTDIVTIRVEDRTPPTAQAGGDLTVDEGTEVTLDGSWSGDNDGIAIYCWTFEDPGPVILHGVEPKRLFSTPGVFVVTLMVTDASGNWDTDTVTITVRDTRSPRAEAGPDQTVDEGTPVTFDGSGSSDTSGMVNHSWTFDDGGAVVLSGASPTYVFRRAGTHVVTLNVTDAAGHWDLDHLTIQVLDVLPPVANAGPDLVVDEGALMAFDGTGSADTGTIAEYTWFLEDGMVLQGPRPTHEFHRLGVFTVILEIKDSAGHSDVDSVNVTVVDGTPPVADAGRDLTGNAGLPVALDGSYSTDNVEIINFTWTVDDGSERVVLYGRMAEFIPRSPGGYLVILNVSDASGLYDTDIANLTIFDDVSPAARAGPDRDVPVGRPVEINGSLSTDNWAIAYYNWSFSYNGSVHTLGGRTVQFTFIIVGTYRIDLTVTDRAGNTGSDSVILTVVDKGRVVGIVLDGDGKAVKDATVVVTASDGKSYTTTTAANGSFALDVFHGDFTWRISKEGYKAISGDSSVAPMDTTELDLSDRPLVKKGEEWPAASSLLTYVALGAILVMVLTALVMVPRRKRGRKRAA